MDLNMDALIVQEEQDIANELLITKMESVHGRRA